MITNMIFEFCFLFWVHHISEDNSTALEVISIMEINHYILYKTTVRVGNMCPVDLGMVPILKNLVWTHPSTECWQTTWFKQLDGHGLWKWPSHRIPEICSLDTSLCFSLDSPETVISGFLSMKNPPVPGFQKKDCALFLQLLPYTGNVYYVPDAKQAGWMCYFCGIHICV